MGEVKKPWLIDANDLLALVKKNAPFIYSILAPITLLCPTVDAVPVVRCKDCMFSRVFRSGQMYCCLHENYSFFTNSEGFCSKGAKNGLEE